MFCPCGCKSKTQGLQSLLYMPSNLWDTCQFVKASNLSKLQQVSTQMLEKESLHHLHVDVLEHATCMPKLSHWTFSMLRNATMRASLKGSNPLVQKQSQGIVEVCCNPAANSSEVLSEM